jgi:hypothetical protein
MKIDSIQHSFLLMSLSLIDPATAEREINIRLIGAKSTLWSRTKK